MASSDRVDGLGWGAGVPKGPAARLRRRFPSVSDLDRRARRRVPRFAYDYLAGGVGAELCIARNRHALDRVEIVPRYGIDVSAVDTGTTLFGRTYSMPAGVAPMGLAGLVWPRADEILAAAAQQAGIPFVLSMVSNASLEDIAAIAPDVLWLQLYAVPEGDHRTMLALIERATRVGVVNVLVMTVDTPLRQKRLRDIRNGLAVPFRPRMRTALDLLRAPLWTMEVLRRGQPRFANFVPYAGANARPAAIASYVDRHMIGATTWELIARVRRAWQGALVVKGIQHPEDAELAIQHGADGILVSNHGGRQFDAAPAAIDSLQAVRERVGDRITVMIDGGIQSGLDILRTLVCGADCAFAGRAFLCAVGALGSRGGDHLAGMLRDELRLVMAQAGILSPREAKAGSGLMRRVG